MLEEIRVLLIGDKFTPSELSFASNVKALCKAYEREHDWLNDDDPGATWEMLFDIECTLTKIVDRLKSQ